MTLLPSYALSSAVPSADDLYGALPWSGAFCSYRSGGDLGPSGWDEGALERRNRVYGEKAPREGTLVPKQVHSLKVLAVMESGGLEEWEGRWEGAALRVDRRLLSLALPGTGAELCRLVGSWEGDGILTDREDLSLGVTVADCMPLFLKSRSGPVRALLHSGWQGTGILAAALAALAAHGAGDVDLLAGPCIAGADYPVPRDRAEFFARRFGKDSVTRCPDSQPGLDMAKANAALAEGSAPCLESGGRSTFSPVRVSTFACCRNSTLADAFLHSYRRDGPSAYGRMLALFSKRQNGRTLI